MKCAYPLLLRCPGALDEAPMAYKLMDELIAQMASTVKLLHRIRPIYNFKAANSHSFDPKRRSPRQCYRNKMNGVDRQSKKEQKKTAGAAADSAIAAPAVFLHLPFR